MNKKISCAAMVVGLSCGCVMQGLWSESRAFFSAFLKSPSKVASIIPSSRFLSRAMCKYTDSLEQPVRILELGAGTGPVTEQIVAKMKEDDVLDVIEINPELSKVLEQKFGHLPNVRILCMSMLDWEPPYKYDFVVSTMPHNTFEPDFVRLILKGYERLIKPGGVISYVELAVLSRLKKTFAFGESRLRINEISQIMNDFREKYGFDRDTVLLNAPPAHAFHLRMFDEFFNDPEMDYNKE